MTAIVSFYALLKDNGNIFIVSFKGFEDKYRPSYYKKHDDGRDSPEKNNVWK